MELFLTLIDRVELTVFLAGALREDVGSGDVTTTALVPESLPATAHLVAREEGTMAGGPVVDHLFSIIGVEPCWTWKKEEGARFKRGEEIGRASASASALLTGERVALNLLQRLCGIATLTRKYADELQGMDVLLLDTRKTIPGMRLLERYAVRVGGGRNHRSGLYDRVLIKDNHVAIVGDPARAVRLARQRWPNLVVEVEVETPAEFACVLKAEPDWILLDNMSIRDIEACVLARQAWQGSPPLLEASGGIDLLTVGRIARLGVDAVSVGALTHSASWLDISMEVEL